MRFALLLIMFAQLAAPISAAEVIDKVPLPTETPAEVIVSGRTGTLKSVTVVATGNLIPDNFSEGQVKNTPGFSWYVSQHYCFKTDYDEPKARFYLGLLEMAFPHYQEEFGASIPGLEKKRLPVVYGKTLESLLVAMKSDGINWDGKAGGITYSFNKTAYQYPSGSAQYHQRSILVHECTHQYQMCVAGSTDGAPNWFIEGAADFTGHLVWEDDKKRVTLGVVDKPISHNYLDEGIEKFKAEPFKFSERTLGGGHRGLNFIMYAFLCTDLDRRMKFQLWRDEVLAASTTRNPGEKLQQQFVKIFEPVEQLDADFEKWLAKHPNSFHWTEWGWEQDGDALMSYGYPNKGPFAQMNLNGPLSKPFEADPLLLDWPPGPGVSPLVDPAKRGVDEPTVAFTASFRKNPKKGQIGLGLGCEERTYLKILLKDEKSLVIDAKDLGGEIKSEDLPAELLKAMSEHNHEAGVSVKIGKSALDIKVRAGMPESFQEFKTSFPLNEAQHERIMKDPQALLSVGGLHFITPYFDWPRTPEPDLSQTAPANRWRSSDYRELYSLYRAAWHLGADAPKEIEALRKELFETATKPVEAQKSALDHYYQARAGLFEKVKASAASDDKKGEALADLCGLSITLYAKQAKDGTLNVRAVFQNAFKDEWKTKVSFDDAKDQPQEFTLRKDEAQEVRKSFPAAAKLKMNVTFEGAQSFMVEKSWTVPEKKK